MPRVRHGRFSPLDPYLVGRSAGWLVGWLVGLTAFVLCPSPVSAQPPPPPIKPSHPTSQEATATDFNFVQNAWDASLASSSGANLINHCYTWCTTANTRSTTWHGFPAGWIPSRLIVRWRATSAFFILAPETTHAEIRVKIEYSVNAGGNWNEVEPEFVSTDQAPAPDVPVHDSPPITLSSSVDPTQVRVRGTLTVRFTSCTNCTLEVSNIGGSVWISDIRMEVAPPTLEVTPDPVTRGDSATFEIKGAPGGGVSNWSYQTAELGSVTRTTNMSSTTWPGIIVAAGTATVRVVLSGATYNLTKELGVNARDWTWPAVSPQQVPNGTLVTLPSPPVPGGELGRMQIDQPYTYDWAATGDNGPNHGFKYLTSATNQATFRYQVSPDLENTGSLFYEAQCGNYSPQNPNGFISGAQLLTNLREHEFGETLGHYQQYVSFSRRSK